LGSKIEIDNYTAVVSAFKKLPKDGDTPWVGRYLEKLTGTAE
jgi:hypothetical protein